MATLNSLTLDVFDLLWGVGQIRRPVRDTLATNVDDGTDVEWQFTTDTMWKRGDLAEYWPGTGAEGEIIYHTEDHPSGADTTVIRAQNQTTAVAGGFTAGDEFLKNNPYPAVLIRRFINEVVDTDLSPHCWYRTQRTLTPRVGRHWYNLNANDFLVESMYQRDTESSSLTNACTFDVTGNALGEDLWQSTAHGLAVGDAFRFTAVGSDAEPYTVDDIYWVITVPDADSFQLSATKGGSVVEGTGADSTGTWTGEKVDFEFVPFPTGYWDTENAVDTSMDSGTGKILRLKQWIKDDTTVYYTARTEPSSSDLTSIPTEIEAMIPWGVVARMLAAQTGGQRIDPTRQAAGNQTPPAQPFQDHNFFQQRFEQMRRQYRLKLMREVTPRKKYRNSRMWRG